ncbi:NADPH-dependent F420 reductase [Paenibacillus sp. GCM10027628]|uniref:NADPH-dependent F420 reductase n=1 Tax=Paenibacillus sp. GCM10027628 TaxID=3273413 RepID=UPI00362AF332
MKISVIGTGRMGKGLVSVLAHQVTTLQWASRTPDKAQELIKRYSLPPTVQAAGYEEALESDVLFHTLWFRDVMPWAQSHREKLRGKILVDVTNPFTEDFNDFTTEWGSSAAEELQKVLPETFVVGAFKNTFFQVFDRPLHQELKSDVYVTGDDDNARQAVMELLKGIPFRVLDGGRLANNRTIERMTLFEREVAIRYGNYPYVSFRMFGLNETGLQSATQ